MDGVWAEEVGEDAALCVSLSGEGDNGSSMLRTLPDDDLIDPARPEGAGATSSMERMGGACTVA